MSKPRLRIALQKKGRLNMESVELLKQCGLQFRLDSNSLFCHCENFPIDLLWVRDDDIPTLVKDNVCQLGIVGENCLQEIECEQDIQFQRNIKLGFSQCRLAIAAPENITLESIEDLQSKRIATSYPNLLRQFLDNNYINADICKISGSVEIAPKLGMAELICDLVSTGRTLEEHNLIESFKVIDSEAVLIQTDYSLSIEQETIKALILDRIKGVLKAKNAKYIMLHTTQEKLSAITELLPGTDKPTVMPLDTANKLAVHAVAYEKIFWSTLEKLKTAGAESILVLPIEKML